eukprot:2094983-Pyramimonas_sp.AAC.1
MGLMGLLSTAAIGAYSVDKEEVADRSSIVLTLLLTVVAFKFVIADSLPKVPHVRSRTEGMKGRTVRELGTECEEGPG